MNIRLRQQSCYRTDRSGPLPVDYGKGVTATVDAREVAVDNEKLMQELRLAPVTLGDQAEALRREGQTVMFVAIDGKPAGLLGVADPIKETTPEAIRDPHNEGIRIDDVEADVLPEQKAAVVKPLQGEGHQVAMGGDGVNDAPALAQADVGIAMGTGTDVAMASAGVTLVRGDLRAIVRARTLSRATMQNIRQNLFFALLYNALGVPIAAGVLYSFFGLLLSPMLASAAMTFSSVSVIANALRLRHADL